jgi:hypothetical protein
MSTNHRVPGRQEKRWPAFVPLVVKSELSPTATEPVSLFREPARNFQMGRPPFNHPRPPLADNYDDDLPPAA